jgi:cyclopropane-fatty-acyl-phospholipid synthase
MNSNKEYITKILSTADVKIDGDRPWDIKVHNDRLYSRVIAGGSLALGESYMQGWWDSEALDEFFNHILGAKIDKKFTGLNDAAIFLKARLLNRQRSHAFNIGKKHYDIGNDLYKAMLDSNMQYSCGYWNDATTLEQAQINKMDMICRKLQLKKGEKLLDIGCGWGGLLKYAAEKYGIIGVGVTVSKEQAALAEENCKDLPIEIRLKDYRTIDEKFDKIVSVGMIEHVGYKNYHKYMKVVNHCLKDDGIFLLHTIGSNITTKSGADPWIDKYIFPDGKLPSIRQLSESFEKLFVVEDWHNFGADYDKTLIAWRTNFNNAWPTLKEKYSDEFYRMWNYYLSCCAGQFRARGIQLWQIVLTKKGLKGGYKRVV